MNFGYRMELRDIEYFTVVAQHGHLGRAAAALGLSQPALSKSLRRLESALQAKLVKRTTKGVELTLEGSTLLARANESAFHCKTSRAKSPKSAMDASDVFASGWDRAFRSSSCLQRSRRF